MNHLWSHQSIFYGHDKLCTHPPAIGCLVMLHFCKFQKPFWGYAWSLIIPKDKPGGPSDSAQQQRQLPVAQLLRCSAVRPTITVGTMQTGCKFQSLPPRPKSGWQKATRERERMPKLGRLCSWYEPADVRPASRWRQGHLLLKMPDQG